MVKTQNAIAAVAATTFAALAGNALDKKYIIRSDIAQIRSARKQAKHWEHMCRLYGDDDWSFYHVLHWTYGQNDYDEAFLFEDRSWTYAELRAEVGRLAIEFGRMGIRNRTVVGMMINNSPEFYFAWWALFKIGAIPAPVNTAITQEPFRHCLKISAAEYLLCSYELYEPVAASLNLERAGAFDDKSYGGPQLPQLRSISIYDYGTYPQPSSLPYGVTIINHHKLTAVTSDMASWPRERRPKIGPEDTSQYLFTSGTTGLPKAATWPTGLPHMAASPHRWYVRPTCGSVSADLGNFSGPKTVR